MAEAYPLQWPDGWPRTDTYHRRQVLGSYKDESIPWGRLMDRLMAGLDGIDAKNPVLSTNLELRLDGLPRADRAAPPDPGVALYFERNGRHVVLAQDGYQSVRNNIRSITIALEHLRGLERHGGQHMMEKAFTGFLALEPPRSWRKVMSLENDRNLTLADARERYETLAMKRHPDHGGTTEAMAELNRAWEAARQEFRQ